MSKSGKDVKRQVMAIPDDYVMLALDSLLPEFVEERIDALAPCTVLTPEEAEWLEVKCRWYMSGEREDVENLERALAILSNPPEAGDEIWDETLMDGLDGV